VWNRSRVGRLPPQRHACFCFSVGAFDWQESDVFVVASSSLGALTKVFTGDLTHKLLRACTVPAVVLLRAYEPDNAAP
jgi:hypothetical protein